MTTGVLVFAFNNEKIDYVSIAKKQAKLIKRHWDLPVTLITDSQVTGIPTVSATVPETNSRWYPDVKEHCSFYNKNRYQAYELSPYDKTILIDVDFLPFTDTIPRMLGGLSGLRLTKSATDVCNNRLPNDMSFVGLPVGRCGTPMYWATIISFDRSPESELFFRMWRQVIDTYKSCAKIYGFPEKPVRNDYAVTIALDRLRSIHDKDFDLPYTIPTVMPYTEVEIGEQVTVLDETETFCVHTDLHVMNKKSLMDWSTQLDSL